MAALKSHVDRMALRHVNHGRPSQSVSTCPDTTAQTRAIVREATAIARRGLTHHLHTVQKWSLASQNLLPDEGKREAGVELLIAHESLTAEQFAPLRSPGAAGGGQVAA
jgi:hypothetical protein